MEHIVWLDRSDLFGIGAVLFLLTAVVIVFVTSGWRIRLWPRRLRISKAARSEIALAKEVAATDAAIEQLLAPILRPEVNRFSILITHPDEPDREKNGAYTPMVTLPPPLSGWGFLDLRKYSKARAAAREAIAKAEGAPDWVSRIGDGHGPRDND